MQMLLFRQVPTRKEESTRPHLPSLLPSSSTHVIIQLRLGRAESTPRIGGILQNFLIVTVTNFTQSISHFDPKKPLCFSGVSHVTAF